MSPPELLHEAARPASHGMKPLRLAIAGAGMIGRAHMLRVNQNDGCKLVALADPGALAGKTASAADVPLFSGLSEMLSAVRPDGVILATPNGAHVEGALACIEAGVPVLVEKPVAETLEDALHIADVAERTGVPVLVGHHRRHSAILERACQVIRDGSLGALVAVTGSATFHKPDTYFADAPWRAEPGGGPILINLIHEIDNLRVLMGDICEVQAFSSRATRGFPVEDTVAINLRFCGGALGSFMLSDCAASPRSWEQTSGENKAYDHHGGEDCYFVSGTQGSLAVPTMRLYSFPGERSWWQPLHSTTLPLDEFDPLERQLEHFCAVIRREQAPRVGVRDAAKTLAVTLAVAKAVQTRSAVAVALTS